MSAERVGERELRERIAARIYLISNPEEIERRGWAGADKGSRQCCLQCAEAAIELCGSYSLAAERALLALLSRPVPASREETK